MELHELTTLIQALSESEVAELIFENPSRGIKLTLRKPVAVVASRAEAVPAPGASGASIAAPTPVAAEATLAAPAGPVDSGEEEEDYSDERYVTITAPMVGTFYRAPSPDAEPFVREGDRIAQGDALCIIEAMKLMNEIESEVNGRIVKILVENGEPVEYGEPLFIVEKE